MKNLIDPASLAFDIDGVFADTMSLFVQIAQDEYDLEGIRYEDITCYTLEECLDIDTEIIQSIVRKLIDGGHTQPLHPIKGAPEVLTRLGQVNGQVLFVTARPYIGPMGDWISKVLPLKPSAVKVVATGSFDTKTEVLKEQDISYFVDDRLDTCFLLKEAGIEPILFKQPWNREDHPFTEVGSWDELESLIRF